MGDVWEVDAFQRELYHRASLDPDEPVGMMTLARALGYDVNVMHPPKFAGDGARVEKRIYLRGGIPEQRQRFALAHELMEGELPLEYRRHLLREEICNAGAAALLAPRRAFTRRHNLVGNDWAQLALPFRISETAAVLRAGEAEDMPTAVVYSVIRLRGPEEFRFPSKRRLRLLAGDGETLPGLAKSTLTDDPARVVLLFERPEYADAV